MNNTERKLKEFVENDEYCMNSLVVKDTKNVKFDIKPIKIKGFDPIDLTITMTINPSITMDDMCVFTINNIQYVTIKEAKYRLTHCNDLSLNDGYIGDITKLLYPEFSAFEENPIILKMMTKKYKYKDNYKIIEHDELKSIFSHCLPNIPWHSREMGKIQQWFVNRGTETIFSDGSKTIKEFRYNAILISLKKLKEVICRFKPIEHDLEIERMDVL